jgi:hypothetical protein
MTPKTIFLFGAGSLSERRSRFAVNPTTGALKASADLRLEARKALLPQSRGMEVRLYLSLARLDVRKFVFQIDGALLGMASDLCGKLPDFPRVRHFLSDLFRRPASGKPRRKHGAGRLFSKSESFWDQRARSSRCQRPQPHGGSV